MLSAAPSDATSIVAILSTNTTPCGLPVDTAVTSKPLPPASNTAVLVPVFEINGTALGSSDGTGKVVSMTVGLRSSSSFVCNTPPLLCQLNCVFLLRPK